VVLSLYAVITASVIKTLCLAVEYFTQWFCLFLG